jgi:hypothetical protein
MTSVEEMDVSENGISPAITLGIPMYPPCYQTHPIIVAIMADYIYISY